MPSLPHIAVHRYGKKLVSRKTVRKGVQCELAWPTAVEIRAANSGRRGYDGVDDHLLLGISSAAAMDFLNASGWPNDYTRSKEDVARNGVLVRGAEIGYDVVQHIRGFLKRMGYKQFSVAEVLFAAGYPKMGYAVAFVSHAQSEEVKSTVRMIRRAACAAKGGGFDDRRWMPVFVDYFCLRQCVPDFDLTEIRKSIGKIGCMVAGLTVKPDGSSDMLGRVWCGYEIYSAVSQGARFTAVMPSEWTRMPAQQIDALRLQECESSHPEDLYKLMDYFNRLHGGVAAANKVVTLALKDVQHYRKVYCLLFPARVVSIFCLLLLSLVVLVTEAIRKQVILRPILFLLSFVALAGAWICIEVAFQIHIRRERGSSIKLKRRDSGFSSHLPLRRSRHRSGSSTSELSGLDRSEPSEQELTTFPLALDSNP